MGLIRRGAENESLGPPDNLDHGATDWPEEDEGDGRNYFVRHWKGELSLAVSYWVNGTILVAVVLVILAWGLGWLEQAGFSLQLIAIVSLLYLLAAALLWIWAVVGIWRSSDRHVERGGAPGWATAAKIVVVLGALATVGQTQNYLLQITEFGALAFGDDPLGLPPEIQVSADGQSIDLSGLITVGTASRFETILEASPGVRAVRLTSHGGRMLEAHRMADSIRSRRLNTHVASVCESACTFLLIAGQARTVAIGSRIGFHQPMFPGQRREDHIIGVQQTRADYERAGITPSFATRALQATPERMWYPDYDELVAANVITEAQLVVTAPSPQQRASSRDMLATELAEVARQIRAQGQRTVDDITTLDGATASGAELTYRYTVEAVAADVDVPSFIAAMAPHLRQQVCGDAEMERTVSRGATFNYLYHDRAGSRITEISVRSCD